MNPQKKRAKGKNFCDAEIAILLDLIEENVNIVENKKTDAVNLKQKNEAWGKITEKFNATNNTEERTITQLKNFYDNFKRKTRKDNAEDKAQLHKTGGGTFVKKLDTSGERLMNLLQKQFEPDKNIFDSSTSYHENQNLQSGNSMQELDRNNEEEFNEDIIRENSDIPEVHNISNILEEETQTIINKEKEKNKKRKATDVYNSLEKLTSTKISKKNFENEIAKFKVEYAKEKVDKIREENLHLKRKHLFEEKKIENEIKLQEMEIRLQEMQIEQEKIKLALMKNHNSLV